MQKLIYLLLCFLFLFACKQNLQIRDFDSEVWKKDRLACKGLRKEQIKKLIRNKHKLIGTSQRQIMSFLGKPDYQELYKRSQKFFIYFYDKGKQCEGKPDIQKGKLIRVRFSALGTVTEVL